MFKRFLRSVVASLLGFLLFTSIFTIFSDLSTDHIVGKLFEDIYDYSDSKAQKNTIDRLSANCVALLSMDEEIDNPDLEKYKDLCADTQKRRQLEETCPKLSELKGLLDSNDYSMLSLACDMLRSGELDEQCKMLNSEIVEQIDYTGIKKVCRDYKQRKLTDKEFFTSSIVSLMPKELPDSPIKKTIDIFELIETYSIILSLVFLAMLTFLYFNEWEDFYSKLGGILINLGTFILLPYLLVHLYIQSNPVDTSFILNTIDTGFTSGMRLDAIKALLPIMVLRTFTMEVLVSASVALALGIILKVLFQNKNHQHNPRQKHIDKHLKMKDYHEKRSI